jgi:hypothetical protein
MTVAETTAQDMVVGIFDTHDQAEQVVHRLIDAGVQADHISILTQGLELKEQVQDYVARGAVARETVTHCHEVQKLQERTVWGRRAVPVVVQPSDERKGTG